MSMSTNYMVLYLHCTKQFFISQDEQTCRSNNDKVCRQNHQKQEYNLANVHSVQISGRRNIEGTYDGVKTQLLHAANKGTFTGQRFQTVAGPIHQIHPPVSLCAITMKRLTQGATWNKDQDVFKQTRG